MKRRPSNAKPARRQGPQVCMICGKPSNESICETCKTRVQSEALEKKLRADKTGKQD